MIDDSGIIVDSGLTASLTATYQLQANAVNYIKINSYGFVAAVPWRCISSRERENYLSKLGIYCAN